MPQAKTTHPTISDVALALATRQRSERSTTTHIERVAKGEIRFSVDVTDPSHENSVKLAVATAKMLDAEFPPPQNGEGK